MFAQTHLSNRPQTMFGSVLEHFATVCTEKVAKRVYRSRMHCFGVPNFRRICSHEQTQLSPIDLKRCLGVFWSISLPFAWKKLQNKSIGAECTISVYRTSVKYIRTNTPTCLQWTSNDVWECFGAFRYRLHEKSCKTGVSESNALFRGTELP